MRTKISVIYKDLNNDLAEERIWTEPLNNGFYKVDNIPFFAPNLALNDIISVEYDEGELYFDNLIEPSGHSTVQIIFFNHAKEMGILNTLEKIGCQWEGINGGRYYSIDIPPKIDYKVVKEILDSELQKSVLDFKEACLAHK